MAINAKALIIGGVAIASLGAVGGGYYIWSQQQNLDHAVQEALKEESSRDISINDIDLTAIARDCFDAQVAEEGLRELSFQEQLKKTGDMMRPTVECAFEELEDRGIDKDENPDAVLGVTTAVSGIIQDEIKETMPKLRQEMKTMVPKPNR